MLDWFQKTARSEAQKPPAAQFLDFFFRELERPITHAVFAERETLVAEVFEYICQGRSVSTLAERQKPRAEEIEKPVHACANGRVVVGHGNVQAGGRFQRQLVPCGGEEKVGERLRWRERFLDHSSPWPPHPKLAHAL